ncbi:TonB-dependent receptor plug domain-containing protein [Enterovibrio norvegicus]|uniref:TonB-dependent receptor plug domain-containing protein n=1 Tax=Enterovibrio norvegicus TaxID=188144 RepID=UPI000C85644D|nr:TonB-dependent receptor plug domain-containing protein [Enterovibrio norvegicus]PML80405.1 TonB-dependent receptor [Enterovibrio norvegicus]
MRIASLAILIAGLSTNVSTSAFAESELDELLNMSLESLSETKVVSATRTALSLADTPAAVHVITAKEIKRSGVRSVADALVLAPGLHVAKFSNYDWGISARTTNEALSNSMLVMVDGRSVFNGMFSGVDWDLIPVSLDNIDRIEVVMGPVGTIWGGNAVHAVINIITLDAEDALRRHVAVSVGNYEYQEYQLHHGGQISENLHLSGYVEFVQHKPWTSDEERVKPLQEYKVYTERFGLRSDYQRLDRTVSVQLGGIRSREDYQWGYYEPHFLNPGHDGPDFSAFDTELLAEEYFAGLKWLQEVDDQRQWEQQFWLTYSSSDGSDRNASFTRFDSETRYTDQNVFGGSLTLGLNYRLIDEHFDTYDTKSSYTLPYARVTDEPDFTNQSVAVYLNYSYPLTDTTELMVGNLWQYFNLVEDTFAQPQIRVMQDLGENQRLWAGWGRAVITPSRLDRSTDFHQNIYGSDVMFCTATQPIQCLPDNYDYLQSIRYLGNEDIPVPQIDTFEIGYRFWDDRRIQFDANLFYSEEDGIPAYQLLSADRYLFGENSSPGTAGTVVDVYSYQLITPLSATTFGGELSMKWSINSQLQVNASYAYKQIEAKCEGSICGTTDVPLRSYENEPMHLAGAQVMWDVTPAFWVSNVVHYVSGSHPDDAIPTKEQYEWPEVVTWDLILGWQYSPRAPLFTLTVENLLNDQVNEFPDSVGGFDNGTQYWLELDWQWY